MAKKKAIHKMPTPKPHYTQEAIQQQIIFVKKEIGIHITNENHRMISYKREELKDLERQLK